MFTSLNVCEVGTEALERDDLMKRSPICNEATELYLDEFPKNGNRRVVSIDLQQFATLRKYSSHI
ncbi:hypothetical protein [Tolypothrix sp. VBCCA 56010]|uniref:hypothetical protein n=1 Tax=Tolypothrix sp. VBCCA 56010 TaxID=3137731 RepID=UPI003D7D0FAE